MFKKCAALLPAALLLTALTGCWPSADAGAGPAPAPGDTAALPVTAMGRWVEEEADLSAFAGTPCLGPFQRQDGSVMLYLRTNAAESCTAVLSRDGGLTWAETEPGWGAMDGVCRPVALGPDGTVLFGRYPSPEATTEEYYLVRPGAAPEPLDTAGVEGFAGFGTGTFYGSDTVLLFYYVNDGSRPGAGGVSADKALLLDVPTGTLTTLAYDHDAWSDISGGQFAAGANGFRFRHFTGLLGTLSLTGEITMDDGQPFRDYKALALTADADGDTYLACADGIARLAAGGTLPEFLVEGLGTALGEANNTPQSLCRLTDGSFLVSISAGYGGDSCLYRYRYDETLPTVSEDGIEVWTLFENTTLRQAVSVFLQQHSDVDVTLTVGAPNLEALPAEARTADDEAVIRDALTTLNTALLAGAGPDVLIMDGVEYENYARRGLLADLSGSLPLDKLPANLTEPFIDKDGSVYVLPARFTVPVILADDGDTADLASLDTLQAAILRMAPRPAEDTDPTAFKEKYALEFAGYQGLGRYLLYTGGAALLRDGALDKGALRRAYAFAQAVGAHYGMAAYGPEWFGSSTNGNDDHDKVTTLPRSDMYLSRVHARWGWELMQTPALATEHRFPEDMLVMTMNGGYPDWQNRIPGTLVSAPGLCAGAWLPGALTAVNASSDHAQAAMEMAATLFDLRVQMVWCRDGLPMRQEALDESIQRNLAEDSLYTGDMAALLQGLQMPVTVPLPLEMSFLTHMRTLLAGSESVDDAVRGVQSDLALYLAERQ